MPHKIQEKLYFRHILEGLIHNINTPLNLILGLSQQLQKQHPEIEVSSKILKAGLHIDDVLHASYQGFLATMRGEEEEFELSVWLENEVKYLLNDLKIKHRSTFSIDTQSQKLSVCASPMMLGYYLETVIARLLEHTSKQSLELELRLDKCSMGTYLVLSVPGKESFGSIDPEAWVQAIKEEYNSLLLFTRTPDTYPKLSCLSTEKEFIFRMELKET